MTELTIHPDFSPLFEAAGLASFDALFTVGEQNRVDGHRLRSVSRIELPGPGGRPVIVYLKRQWGLGAVANIRDLLRFRRPEAPWRHELAAAQKLIDASIPVSLPVAWGEHRDPDQPRSLLAFLEVQGPSLATWLHRSADSDAPASGSNFRAPPPRLRRAIAEEIGRAVRRLHDAGFSMPDLYAKHLLLEALNSGRPRVVLIDVSRLRRLTRSRVAEDLAALLTTTLAPTASRTDRLRFLRAYLGGNPRTSAARRLIRLVERIASRGAGRGRDPRLVYGGASVPPGTVPLADEKFTTVDARRLTLNEAFRPTLEAASLTTLDALMAAQGGRTFREVSGRRTVRLELADPAGGTRNLFLKRYIRVPWRQALRRTLCLNPPTSQARREAGGVLYLAELGIATMRVVAIGEAMTRHGRREQSCFVTEEIAGATQADVYCQAKFAPPCPAEATAAKRRLILAMAAMARRLHGGALVHRDFYLCHILVRPVAGADPVLHLIDLQRLVRHRRGLGERWIVKDLAALLFSSWPSAATFIRSAVFTRTDAMRFALAYFDAPRLAPEQKRLVRRVLRKARRMARREAARKRGPTAPPAAGKPGEDRP